MTECGNCGKEWIISMCPTGVYEGTYCPFCGEEL